MVRRAIRKRDARNPVESRGPKRFIREPIKGAGVERVGEGLDRRGAYPVESRLDKEVFVKVATLTTAIANVSVPCTFEIYSLKSAGCIAAPWVY